MTIKNKIDTILFHPRHVINNNNNILPLHTSSKMSTKKLFMEIEI